MTVSSQAIALLSCVWLLSKEMLTCRPLQVLYLGKLGEQHEDQDCLQQILLQVLLIDARSPVKYCRTPVTTRMPLRACMAVMSGPYSWCGTAVC